MYCYVHLVILSTIQINITISIVLDLLKTEDDKKNDEISPTFRVPEMYRTNP